MGPNLRIVIFDLGGVLVRIRRSVRTALAASGWAGEGAPVFRDLVAYRKANDAYQSGLLSLDDFVGHLNGQLSESVERTAIVAMHDAVLAGEYDGAAKLVDAVHAAGFQAAILSNTCARHWETLSRYPSVESISQTKHFLSFKLGCVKPDAPIYQLVEETLGYSSSEIAFLDDSAVNVAAARERGWQAAQVPYERDNCDALWGCLEGLGIEV